jgi:O-antigen/teichoic acid export membrane protein
MDDITSRAKEGAFWTLIQQVVLRAFSFITSIVLARLLLPEHFGIVGIALVAWEIIRLFGNLGIGAKLIYQQSEVEKYAASAFWLNIIISLALAIITAAVAPYVASFYNNDLVRPILMLFSLAFVIHSFGSTHLALLNKELAFKKIVLIEIILTLLSKSFAIGMAFTGFGVWSLVVPEVIASPFRVIALWIVNPWRPGFRLNIKYWKDIFRFGFNYLGADLTRYLNINGDYMIIGKMLGERSLGLYTFAYNLANLPFDNIVGVMAKVAFPTFSKLQNDIRRFQTVFLRMTKITSLVSFPLLVELFVLADLIVPLVYGNKWRESIVPLQIIAGFVLFRVFSSPSGQVLFALGRPDLLFRFNLIQAPFLLGGVFIGSRYGIEGAALGMSGVLMIGSLFLVYISTRPLALSLRDVLGMVLPALASSVFMAFLIEFLKAVLLSNGLKSYFALPILIPLGLGAYLLILFLLFKDDFGFLWNVIWEDVAGRFFVFKKPTPSRIV